jgi:hypothetical protein
MQIRNTLIIIESHCLRSNEPKSWNNSRLQLAYNLQHNKPSSQLTTQQAIKTTTKQPKVTNTSQLTTQASLQHKYATSHQGNYLTTKSEHTNLSSHDVALAHTQSPRERERQRWGRCTRERERKWVAEETLGFNPISGFYRRLILLKSVEVNFVCHFVF